MAGSSEGSGKFSRLVRNILLAVLIVGAVIFFWPFLMLLRENALEALGANDARATVELVEDDAAAEIDIDVDAPAEGSWRESRARVCATDPRAQNCPNRGMREASSSGGSERGGSYHRESGGSRVTVGGYDRFRISDTQTAETPRCDSAGDYCWRFPSGYPQESAQRVIAFIRSEVRDPGRREVPPELNRWEFTDTVPVNGAADLASGGQVVWVQSSRFANN